MSPQDEKIWEILKLDKAPDPKAGYGGRFWGRLSQKKAPQRWADKIFIPKPWALTSAMLSVFIVLSLGVTVHNKVKMDAEIANNLELAKYWQGIEHADVVEDLDVIEKGVQVEDS